MEQVDLLATEEGNVCSSCQKNRAASGRRGGLNHSAITYGVLLIISLYTIYADLQHSTRLREAETKLFEMQHALDIVLERHLAVPPENKDLTLQSDNVQPLETEELNDMIKKATVPDTRSAIDPRGSLMQGARLLRTKRAKRSGRKKRNKKCKNCLPSIQVEGTAGPQQNPDKTDQESYWTVSSWVNPRDNNYFTVDELDYTGRIHVKKAGLYIVYAQMTLIGCSKQGFHVNVINERTPYRGSGNFVLSTCYSSSSSRGTCNPFGVHEDDTCQTFRVARLSANDRVYIQESTHNSGADFSITTSFFGLVRISE